MTVLDIANELNRIYDTKLTNDLVVALEREVVIADVLLLCAQCREPIKARVNTSNWIRAEFIDGEGRCLRCHQEAKKVVRG